MEITVLETIFEKQFTILDSSNNVLGIFRYSRKSQINSVVKQVQKFLDNYLSAWAWRSPRVKSLKMEHLTGKYLEAVTKAGI